MFLYSSEHRTRLAASPSRPILSPRSWPSGCLCSTAPGPHRSRSWCFGESSSVAFPSSVLCKSCVRLYWRWVPLPRPFHRSGTTLWVRGWCWVSAAISSPGGACRTWPSPSGFLLGVRTASTRVGWSRGSVGRARRRWVCGFGSTSGPVACRPRARRSRWALGSGSLGNWTGSILLVWNFCMLLLQNEKQISINVNEFIFTFCLTICEQHSISGSMIPLFLDCGWNPGWFFSRI